MTNNYLLALLISGLFSASLLATESTENSKDSKATSKDEVSIKQAAVIQSTVDLKKQIKKEKVKRFTGTLDMTFTTDSKRTEEDKALGATTWIFLRYKLSDEYSSRLWITIDKDLAQSYETQLGDTRFTISKKAKSLTDKLKLAHALTLVAPTSERSKRNEEMIAGIEVDNSFSYQVSKQLSLSYLPRVVKNFHEFETSRTNTVNSEYRVLQFIGASYLIGNRWSFNPLLIYVDSWSYQGTQRDPNYLTVLELGYAQSKKLFFAAGVMTGGSIFDRQNGPNENIELYDKNTSSLYVKYALNF